MTATYDPIATTTLSSAASTITFSSIPNTFTDLRIVFFARAAGGAFRVRLNSDTGTNYSRTYVAGDGSTTASSRSTNSSQIFLNYGTGTPSTTNPTFIGIDIFSYAGSTNKTLLWEQNMDLNGSGEVVRGVGLWRNTSAITSIELSNNSVNLDTGTTATLYGIKAE